MDIQLALDFDDLNIATTYIAQFEGILPSTFEYGSPLVVNFGVAGFKKLHTIQPMLTYIDCKTMDFPHLEWRNYIQWGATEITGMLFVEETVSDEMLSIKQIHNIDVCISTMGYTINYLTDRVRRFRDKGFKTFIAHAANANRQSAFDTLRSHLDMLANLAGIRIYAGGGIGIDNVDKLRGYPIERLIVGRSLSTEASPAQSLTALKQKCDALWF